MAQYQVVVRGVLSDSGQLRNIHYYDFPGYVPTDANLQAFTDEFDSNLKVRLRPYLATNVRVANYGFRRIDIADQPEILYVPTALGWLGNSPGEQLPAPVSAMVSFKALTAYPRNARTYLFPMGEDNNAAGGTIGTDLRNAIVGYAGDILTIVIPGADSAVKIAVRFTEVPRIVLSFNVVSTIVVPTTWRTQRRRRLGVGA